MVTNDDGKKIPLKEIQMKQEMKEGVDGAEEMKALDNIKKRIKFEDIP